MMQIPHFGIHLLATTFYENHFFYHQHVVQNDKYLLWGIDDPSVVAKLEHTKHRREYTVGQEESQPLRTSGIIEMANKHLF